MAKPCGCTFWTNCAYHGKRWADKDAELSSLAIVRGLDKANKRLEDSIQHAEAWAERFRIIATIAPYAIVVGLAYYWFW